MPHLCPVCGFPELTEAPRSKSSGGSYEICPSCGFQFGVDDDDKRLTHAAARAKWVASGMKWSSARPQPKDWNPAAQLAAVTARAPTRGQKT